MELDGRFIHELIHHIEHCNLKVTTEDEDRMLQIAKQYIPDSWIPRRFEQYIKSPSGRKYRKMIERERSEHGR
jgi:hypothetical protein